MPKIVPQLMFEGAVEPALSLWRRAFPDMKVAPGTPTEVEIAGQRLRLFDRPVHHDFRLTPSFSLFVTCETEDEVRRLTDILGGGGQVFMPLGSYDFSACYTWIADRVGVSWQIGV